MPLLTDLWKEKKREKSEKIDEKLSWSPYLIISEKRKSRPENRPNPINPYPWRHMGFCMRGEHEKISSIKKVSRWMQWLTNMFVFPIRSRKHVNENI